MAKRRGAPAGGAASYLVRVRGRLGVRARAIHVGSRLRVRVRVRGRVRVGVRVRVRVGIRVRARGRISPPVISLGCGSTGPLILKSLCFRVLSARNSKYAAAAGVGGRVSPLSNCWNSAWIGLGLGLGLGSGVGLGLGLGLG